MFFIGFPEIKVTERVQRAATKNSGNRGAVYRTIQAGSVSRLEGIPVAGEGLSRHWRPFRSRQKTHGNLRAAIPGWHRALRTVTITRTSSLIHVAVTAIVQHCFHVICIARIEILQRQHADAEHQQKRECGFPYSHDVAVQAVLFGY